MDKEVNDPMVLQVPTTHYNALLILPYSMAQVVSNSNMDVGGSKYFLVSPIKNAAYKFKFKIFVMSKRMYLKNLTSTIE